MFRDIRVLRVVNNIGSEYNGVILSDLLLSAYEERKFGWWSEALEGSMGCGKVASTYFFT